MSKADTTSRADIPDVVIVGAGLSGICAAWHLRQRRPQDRIVILEARDAIGGTWDLFRYPGVRSDSDMATLGYGFRPWLDSDAIAHGARIRQYIENTAAEHDIRQCIRFGHKLKEAHWSTDKQRWRLQVETDLGETEIEAGFVMLCTGYYDYDEGFTPELPGIEQFTGQVIHPQHWPESLDWSGTRIAVVGSGATAVTLIPALAERAERVTMIQRTPSYVAALPARDALSRWCHRWLGARVAHWFTRWKNILYTMMIFQMSRRFPDFMRRHLLREVRAAVGDRVDVDRHFSPPYDPWDQRLCIAPDGDFFEAIQSGSADVATGTIAGFDRESVRLADGSDIPADLLITATGLQIKVAGGAKLYVDGERIRASQQLTYKGAMLSGVPNLALTMGYTNASWTLKCELIAKWVVRVRDHMQRTGVSMVYPQRPTDSQGHRPFIDLDAGYIRRAEHKMPRQSSENPWQVHQNYFLDLVAFRWSSVDDGVLQFSDQFRSSPQPGSTAVDQQAS